MREILFRGKMVDSNEWVYGDLLQSRHFNGDYKTSIMEQTPAASNFKVRPKTVGQFTGLKDANGIKIFDGDIMRHEWHGEHYLGLVQWDSGGLWTLNHLNGDGEKLYEYEGDVIVGNIYDNPEFLEVE